MGRYSLVCTENIAIAIAAQANLRGKGVRRTEPCSKVRDVSTFIGLVIYVVLASLSKVGKVEGDHTDNS